MDPSSYCELNLQRFNRLSSVPEDNVADCRYMYIKPN